MSGRRVVKGATSRCVGLVAHNADDMTSRGSGVLLSPRYVATARHVVVSKEGRAAKKVDVSRCFPSGTTVRRFFIPQSGNVDVAVMEMSHDDPATGEAPCTAATAACSAS